MKEYIELMKELGFIDTTGNRQGNKIVKQFTKYNDNGLITDTINYFYTRKTGVTVFTNSVKHAGGCRLDHNLLFAVQSIFYELQRELEKGNKRK